MVETGRSIRHLVTESGLSADSAAAHVQVEKSLACRIDLLADGDLRGVTPGQHTVLEAPSRRARWLVS